MATAVNNTVYCSRTAESAGQVSDTDTLRLPFLRLTVSVQASSLAGLTTY